MMVPTPDELFATYGCQSPEDLAASLGIQVMREDVPPSLPGVTVFSEYRPSRTIVLYPAHIRDLAARRGDAATHLEQWHIAHELYHALAESGGLSPWRAIETAADLWADELMQVYWHSR